jgi:virulence-associated protein VagC
MKNRAKLFEIDGDQAVLLPEEYQFKGQEEVVIYREGFRIVLEPVKRAWSRDFLELIGSAPDFPYPDEPPPVEPGPDLDLD